MRFVRAMATKVPIYSLPLPPSTHLLTHCLTPDPLVKSPFDFLQVLKTNPSIQRRSRALAAPSHFSFVSPLPIQFPYRIEPPNPPPPEEEKGAYIEKWLGELEAQEEEIPPSSTFRKYHSKNRDQDRVLLGLSETGLRDCLPHLDVGDAFLIIGTPSLSSLSDAEQIKATDAEIDARKSLVDVLSGHSLLVAFDDQPEAKFAPWSLRYSGHQFGTWAGQLGDGRAISVCKHTST